MEKPLEKKDGFKPGPFCSCCFFFKIVPKIKFSDVVLETHFIPA